MNKKVELKSDFYVLFIINILILLSLILFNYYYRSLEYYNVLLNVMLIINILLLVLGIFLNIILVIKNNSNKKKIKRNIFIFLITFLIYIIINTVGVYLINKPFYKGYAKISERLSNYCSLYKCNKYETSYDGIYEIFSLEKNYYDYNNNENDILISIKYDSKKIKEIKSVIYSENELFSEDLIANELNLYYENFGYELDKNKIKQAFNNRFENQVNDNDIYYKVEEVYKNSNLYKIKTIITLKLND